MVSNNADQIVKELEQYSVQLTRKLEQMVAGFAGDVVLSAALATPRATEEYVQSHQSLYERRKALHGIEIEPGFHQGSWQYSENIVKIDPDINSPAQAEYLAREKASTNYKLGDSFVIGSESPNMEYLNQRDNIAGAVTENSMLAAYSSNLQQHFDSAG